MSKNRGFTLIELMIVVAIIGILAAIAIPNFIKYQYRSRSAELPTNVTAIKTSAIATSGVIGTFLNADPSPTACQTGALLTESKCDWRPTFDADGNDTDQTDFSGIGWIPEGPVYGQYVVTAGCNVGGRNFCFNAEASADIDGDTNTQVVQYAKPAVDGVTAAASRAGVAVPCLRADLTGANAWEAVEKCGDSAGVF